MRLERERMDKALDEVLADKEELQERVKQLNVRVAVEQYFYVDTLFVPPRLARDCSRDELK